jgi:hypothetical protein
MNGLEAILFAVFIIFVLINLLIRFVVRRSRRQREKGGSAPADAEGAFSEYEEDVKAEEEPLFPPSGVREAFDAEWVPRQAVLQTREEITLESQAETGAPAEQKSSIPPTMEREEAVSEEIATRSMKSLEGTLEVVVGKEEKEQSFWERIGRLPALQRAIVLSEVLGPPKGIEKTD